MIPIRRALDPLLSRTVIIACLVLAYLSVMVEKVASQDKVDYYTVLESLHDYEETLNSLCITGRYKLNFQRPHDRKNNYSTKNDHNLVDFACDLKNDRWRYDQRHSWIYNKFSEEPFENRRINLFDGHRSYQLFYTFAKEPTDCGFPPERPYRLSVREETGTRLLMFGPKSLAGLHLNLSNIKSRSLAHVLLTQATTWEGKDQIRGVPTYKVTIRLSSENSQLAVWFDPAHGFLPIRRKRLRLDNNGRPTNDVRSMVRATEFQEFLLPSGKTVWFPVRGQRKSWGDLVQTLEIFELRFVDSLPIERFQVETENLPPGVHVENRADGEDFYTGGDDGQRLYEEWQRLFDVVDEKLKEKLGIPRHALPREATPAEIPSKNDEADAMTWGLRNALFLMGLLLAIGIYVRLRKRRLTNN